MATNFVLLAVVVLFLIQSKSSNAVQVKKFSPCSTPVVDCSTQEDSATIHMVHLNDCSRPPCRLIKGSSSKLEIVFTPKYDSSQFTIDIRGIISGIPVPWAVPGGNDACPLIEPKPENGCIKAGVRQTLTLDIPILASYPSITLMIHLKFKDAEDRTQVCLKMRAELKSA